ncbi:MAG TPA: hypothetical protein VLD66_09310 [Methyloceanibacter sp.]|nr:hypothetical protein [Methyloceanibacter sp.]
MARKSPVSYAAVELVPIEELAPRPSVAEPDAPAPARHGRRPTLKEAAAPVMLYLDPAALKALKRYALDQNTKVHSLLLDAVESWFKSHGLRGPVRVQTARKRTGIEPDEKSR